METSRKLFLLPLFLVLLVCYMFSQNLIVLPSKSQLKFFDSNFLVETQRQISDDSDLVRQKELYNRQAADRRKIGLEENYVRFLFSWVPQISCPTMVRVGTPADGGKWICNPWRLPKNCTVFSLGVGGDVSFEKELSWITNETCNFYFFDNNPGFGALVATVPHSRFEATMVVANDPKTKAPFLLQYAKNKGISMIDILKIDIESSEYSVVPSLFSANFTNVSIAQISIEVHHTDFLNGGARIAPHRFRNLLAFLESQNFVLFSKEPNHYSESAFTGEFSFIHKDYLDWYGLKESSIFNPKNSR